MNRERYIQVLQQITEHPSTWDQKSWHCGSSHCFAGWTQKMGKGYENDEMVYTTNEGRLATWLELMRDGISHLQVIHNFCACRAFFDAMELLELSVEDATYLFHSSRTIQDFFDFLRKYDESVGATDLNRESDSVTGTAPAEDAGASCVGDHQPDLCGVGTER